MNRVSAWSTFIIWVTAANTLFFLRWRIRSCDPQVRIGQGTSRRNSLSIIASLLVASATTVGHIDSVFAIGNERQLRGEDLVLTVDTRWAGNANGGYYPVRIRVLNRGKARILTFRITSDMPSVPRVSRTIQADQNSSVQFTLPVPMVGQGTYAELRVEQSGRELKNLGRVNIIFPDVNYGSPDRTALLVISPTNVDCHPFEQAVTSISHTSSSGTSPYSGSGFTSDHQVIPPTLLPDSWLSYSGLDLVAISLDTLTSLRHESRSAILKWVHQGGNLIVYEVGESAHLSEPLRRLLQLHNPSAATSRWVPANPNDRQVVKIIATDESGNVLPDEQEAKPDSQPNNGSSNADAEFLWPGTADTFSSHPMMLGHVYAFPNNPFPGSIHDWAWFLRTPGANCFLWSRRHGISARQNSSEFLKFLIPGIQGVPVFSFLTLITVFTLVIGPLNYFYLLRRKRLYLMILTIPVIALVTSLSLFGYSVVAHGFSIKSRVRSLTVLDQNSKTAVTASRVAIYAGLTPSEGLQFSPETAVYPLWPTDQEFESGSVDWTQNQSLRSGWLRSRTRTQFVTITHRNERGRIEVEAAADNRLPIANGLQWELEAVVVSDEKGDLYFGRTIPPGATTTLLPATQDKLAAVEVLLDRYPLKLPAGVTSSNAITMFNARRSMRYYRRFGAYPRTPISFSGSLMEQNINRLKNVSDQNKLPVNSYFAVLKQSPPVDIGVTKTKEIAHHHVLIGFF